MAEDVLPADGPARADFYSHLPEVVGEGDLLGGSRRPEGGVCGERGVEAQPDFFAPRHGRGAGEPFPGVVDGGELGRVVGVSIRPNPVGVALVGDGGAIIEGGDVVVGIDGDESPSRSAVFGAAVGEDAPGAFFGE